MNRLRFLRTEKGESLEKIAKYLNVTIQTISNYETEKRDMTPDTILKLAEYFNTTTDYLLGKSDIRNPKTDDLIGLAKIGFNMENYNPPTDTQKEQIKQLIEIILKDNKKENK
jgi:transcriptional regulator with XRE-family HTH domain